MPCFKESCEWFCAPGGRRGAQQARQQGRSKGRGGNPWEGETRLQPVRNLRAIKIKKISVRMLLSCDVKTLQADDDGGIRRKVIRLEEPVTTIAWRQFPTIDRLCGYVNATSHTPYTYALLLALVAAFVPIAFHLHRYQMGRIDTSAPAKLWLLAASSAIASAYWHFLVFNDLAHCLDTYKQRLLTQRRLAMLFDECTTLSDEARESTLIHPSASGCDEEEVREALDRKVFDEDEGEFVRQPPLLAIRPHAGQSLEDLNVVSPTLE